MTLAVVGAHFHYLRAVIKETECVNSKPVEGSMGVGVGEWSKLNQSNRRRKEKESRKGKTQLRSNRKWTTEVSASMPVITIDTNGSNSLLKDTDSQIEWKTRSAIYL